MARSSQVRRLDKLTEGLRTAANAVAAMSRAQETDDSAKLEAMGKHVRAAVAGLKVEVDLALMDIRKQLSDLRADLSAVKAACSASAKRTTTRRKKTDDT